MNPDGFEEQLKESQAIIHTVGVLIDSSIRKWSAPGGPGSYE